MSNWLWRAPNVLNWRWWYTRDPLCRAMYCDSCCGPKLFKGFVWNWPSVMWSNAMSRKQEISYLREQALDSNGSTLRKVACPVEFERDYPALSEHMCSFAYPSGAPRELSTLTLAFEDGLLKGCINDRTNERSLWRTAPTILELLCCLELAVQDPRASWRNWKPTHRTKRRD
jgi:hypothetical protein